jgi:hypothetical protein
MARSELRIDNTNIRQTVQDLHVITLLADVIGPAQHIRQAGVDRDAVEPAKRVGRGSLKQRKMARLAVIEKYPNPIP